MESESEGRETWNRREEKLEKQDKKAKRKNNKRGSY